MESLHWRHLPAEINTRSTPVLLIHGLFGSLENLAGIAKILSQNGDVYSVDLPNHARSPHTQTTSLSKMASHVLAWLDEQKIPQVSIVGHSLGGKVAMELALTHGERVASLAVLDIAPVHYSPHHGQVFDGLNSLDLQQVDNRRAADAHLIQFVPTADVRTFLLKNLVKSRTNNEGVYSWRFNLPVLTRDYPELVDANSEGVFAGRTLFLKGGRSDYIIETYRNAIIRRFPNTSLKIVENTGHWLHAEKPSIVGRLVAKFLDDG